MISTDNTITQVFGNFVSKGKNISQDMVPCKYILKCPYYSPNSSQCENPVLDEECVVSQVIMAGFL